MVYWNIRRMEEKIVQFVESFTRPPVTGMDISDRAIKFLKFTTARRGVAIETWGEFPLPEGALVKGEIQNRDGLVASLAAWRRKSAAGAGSLIVASLPEEKSFLRTVKLPRVKPEEVANAIRWEIEENIPLPSNELIYDYEIIAPSSPPADHLDAMLTAFPKAIVESYLDAFRRAGLQLAALELESQAIVRAVTPDLADRRTRVIIEMGKSRSGIIVWAGGAITFTATIDLGGKILEENIARSLDISPEEANAVKKLVGLDKRAYDGKIFQALIPALDALKDELQQTIAYYREHLEHIHEPDTAIQEVVLAGGDASLKGLDTYLASILKTPVRRADPFAAVRSRLPSIVPPIPKQRAAEFTTAIGNALRPLL